MRYLCLSIILMYVFFVVLAPAQEKPLTNQDVIDLVSIGLSDDVVIQKIRTAPATAFDTSVDGIRVLKSAKVSDAVLKCMISPKDSPPSRRVMDELSTKFRQLQNGVVTVWSEFGHGTGFIISRDGLVLTNQHVVGPSDYIALQFDPKRKVSAVLLASDPQRDIAVLWCDLSKIPEAMSLEIAKKDELNPSLMEGERVFTIGSPLNQQKIITSGIASKIERTAIISDVNINHGNSGGPLFNSEGKVVGITAFGDFTSQGGPGISGILKIEEALPLIQAARSKMGSVTRPSSDFLPVEPEDTFPIEAIKATLQQEKFDARPYSFGSGDFDIVLITPPLKYRAEMESQIRAAKEKGKRNKRSEAAIQNDFQPLDDLKNWAQYVGEYKPVIFVRATPRLRETGGSIFLRSLAAAGGTYAPAKMRFKADFYRMKLFCGPTEVTPILPGKIAHVIDVRNGLVNATDATYEGFYEFPADSIKPSCGDITLSIFSEKKPDAPIVKKLNVKTVQRVFDDFSAYRQEQPKPASMAP